MVAYLSACHDTLAATLDGKNLSEVLQELGIRLFFLLQSHIFEYQYTAAGEWVGWVGQAVKWVGQAVKWVCWDL